MNKKDRLYFIRQKIIGALMTLLGIATIFIEWDGTMALLLVPWGIWMIFSKEHLID